VPRPDARTRTIRWLRYEAYRGRKELRIWRALVRAHEANCPRCLGSDDLPTAFCAEYWALMRRVCELGGWLDVLEALSPLV
jgi:hypothetical protein